MATKKRLDQLMKQAIDGSTAPARDVNQQAKRTGVQSTSAFDMNQYKQLAQKMLQGKQKMQTSAVPYATGYKSDGGFDMNAYLETYRNMLEGKTPVQTTQQAQTIAPLEVRQNAYSQITEPYYQSATEEAQKRKQMIQEMGGWAQLSQEQLDQLAGYQTRYNDDVSFWGWLTSGDYKDALGEAQKNYYTDVNSAKQSGAFDTWENLVLNPSMVSDEYLAQWQQALPGLWAEELRKQTESTADYQGVNKYISGLDRTSSVHTTLKNLSDFAGQIPEDDYAYFNEAVAGVSGGEENYGNVLAELLALDNAMNLSNRTAADLEAMSEQERAADVRRMLDQYTKYAIQGADYRDLGAAYSPVPYDVLMSNLQTEIDSRSIVNPLMDAMLSDPDVLDKVGYVFTGRAKKPVKKADGTYGDLNAEGFYYVINNDPEYRLTDPEVALFNYWYNDYKETGDIAQAEAIKAELEDIAARRERDLTRADWEFLATDNAVTGALMAAGTFGANVLSPISTGITAIGEMATGEESANPDIFWDFTNTTRSAQMAALGEVDTNLWKIENEDEETGEKYAAPTFLGKTPLQYAYGAVMNAGDMAAAIGLSALTGGAVPALGIMGAEAGANEYNALHGQNMEPLEKTLRAVSSGVIEALTEKLPLDEIMNGVGTGWHTLKSGASEFGEEVTSGAGGIAIDKVMSWIFGHSDEITNRVATLKLMNVGNAEEQVAGEIAEELLAQGVEGFFGGTLMGGTGSAVNYTQNVGTGRAINKSGGAESLVQLGQAMAEGTQSNQTSAEITQDTKNGKKISAAKLGKLYRSLMAETTTQYHEDIRETTVSAVEEALGQKYADLGETLEGDFTTQEIAEAIVTANGNPNAIKGKIGSFIRTHRGTNEIMMEFREGNAEWSNKLTNQMMSRRMSYASQIGAIQATTKKQSTNTTPSAEAVTEQNAGRVETLTGRKGGKEIKSMALTMVDASGNQATATFKRATREKGNISLVVEQSGEEKTVTMDDVAKISGTNVANVLAYAENHREIRAEEINTMVQLTEKTNIASSRIIAGYEAGVNAGYQKAAKPNLPELTQGMSKADAQTMTEIVQMGYSAGAAEADAAEAERIQKAQNRKTLNNGGIFRVTYLGEHETMDGLRSAGVHMSMNRVRGELTEQQNAAVDVLTQVSQTMGVNVAFYRSTAEAGQKIDLPNGFYDDAKQTIYIDLNAGQNEGGETVVENAIMQTAAHELTHYIELGSADGYNQYRQAVKDSLQKQGKDYMQLVLEKVQTSEETMTRAEAEAEVIADASELMLRDTKAIQELAQNNRRLATRIARFVTDFARRIKRAIGSFMPTTKESAALTEMKDGVLKYVDGLQEAWDKALIEAAGRTDQNESGRVKKTTAREFRTVMLEEVTEQTKAQAVETLTNAGDIQMTESVAGNVADEIIEAAVDAAIKSGETLAQRMDSDALNELANDAAETEADRGAVHVAAVLAAGEVRSIEGIGTAVENALGEVYAMGGLAGKTAEQTETIRKNIETALRTAALRADLPQELAQTEDGEILRATQEAAGRAVEAVYEGENENVRTAMNELAENAAAEAVEGMAFQQAVDAAETRAQAREQGVEISEGVKYSERRNRQNEDTTLLYKNKDLSTDKSLYDYDFLVSLPDIQVSTEGDLTSVLDEDGHIDRPKFKKMCLENAAKYGTVLKDGTVAVTNAYTGRAIQISGRGVDHSTHTRNQVKNKVNARASLSVGELAVNAVPLNAEFNKSRTAEGTYVMAAPLKNTDGDILSVAVLTMESRSGNVQQIEVYDLLHSLSVRKKNEVGLDGEAPSPEPPDNNAHISATRSSYSIAEFLKIVNSTHQSLLSEDVLAHFDETRNPNGYYSDRVKFSRRRATAPSFRQAMMDMPITDDMTPLEKELLTKYKGYVQEYNEKQEQINAQAAIISAEAEKKENADKDAVTKANNRMTILKTQQRRVEEKLYQAEKRGGYANLMNRYRAAMQAYMAGDSVEEAGRNIARQIASVERQLEKMKNSGMDLSPKELEEKLTKLVNKQQVDKVVNAIVQEWNPKLPKTKIRQGVAMHYALMAGGAEDSSKVQQHLEQFIRDMTPNTDEAGQYRLEVLRDNVAGSLILDKETAEEIKTVIGSVAEYRNVVRKVFKSVRVAKDGEKGNVDVLLENAPDWVKQELFGSTENEKDFALAMYDIILNARAQDVYSGQEGAELMKAQTAKLLAIMEKENATKADRRVRNLLNEWHNGTLTGKDLADAELSNAIDALWVARKKAYELSKETNAKELVGYYARLNEQNRLEQERENLQKAKEAVKTTIASWYEERYLLEQRRKLHDSIKRQVEWMDRRIRRETDQRRIPEGLKPLVEEAVRTFARANDVMTMFPEAEAARMLQVYEKLKTVHGTDVTQMNDLLEQDLQNALDALNEKIESYSRTAGEKGERMTREERLDRIKARVSILQDISDVVDEIRGAVDNADDIFMGGKQLQLAKKSSELETQMRGKDNHTVRGKAVEWADRTLHTGNLTPPYFFRELGQGVMTELNQDLLDAQDKHAFLFEDARETIAGIQKKYNYFGWKNRAPLTITTWQGRNPGANPKDHTIQLTAEEALSLWATWKREHSGSDPLITSSHLERGGFNLAHGTRKDGKKTVTDKTPHRLNLKDMAKIEAYLTEDMKAYATAMVDYMSHEVAELGNETSMKLFNIRKFTEENYFPMKVQRVQLEEKSNAGRRSGDDTNRIANFAGSKRRVNEASKPLEIGSFTDVAADHINQMITYATFAIPIENFNKILNQSISVGEVLEGADGEEIDATSRMTLRGLFEQKYGTEALNYLRNYLTDVNGGPSANRRDQGVWKKMTSLYKRSAVVASLSVAIQQPMSVWRAMNVMNPKYFVQQGKGTGNVRKEWEQLTQYSGVALIKERGGFDMTGSRTLASKLAGSAAENYGALNTLRDAAKAVNEKAEGERATKIKEAQRAINERLDNIMGTLPAKADQATWSYIWRAVKAETADRNPGMDVNSDAFLETAAARFEEVINLTQVYDSTLVRSQSMRSKDPFMQMVTAFMAEPTLTANMLMDGLRRTVQTKNPKPIAKAMLVFAVSQVMTAAAKAIVTAGRDDDEEKPWVEKYLNAVESSLFGIGGDLNPLNLFPWVSDAISIVEGYDVSRSDMDALDTLITEARKVLSGKYADDPWKGMENAGGAVATMFGIPLKNMMRDLRTGYNTLMHIVDDRRDVNALAMMDDLTANLWHVSDRDNGWYGEAMYKAMVAGDEKELNSLKEYMAIRGKDESQINTMIREAVKGKVLAGEMTEADAKKLLVEYGLAEDQKDAYRYVDRWVETEANKGVEGYTYSQYNSVYAAINDQDVKAINASVKELKDNGFLTEKGTMKTTLRNKYRDQMLELYRTNKTAFANLQSMLVTTLVAAGYKRDEALEYVKSWLKTE